MKKKHNLYIFVVILALIAALIYMQKSSESSRVANSTLVQATKVAIGDLSLAYPTSYGVYEKANSPYTKTLNTIVWYDNTETNRSFFTGGPGSPSLPPTAISLDIYSNPKNLTAKELLGGDIPYMFASGDGQPIILAGLPGSLLLWDVLYKGKSVAVNHDGLLYVFSVTSVSQSDKIVSDFDLLLSSISFKQ